MRKTKDNVKSIDQDIDKDQDKDLGNANGIDKEKIVMGPNFFPTIIMIVVIFLRVSFWEAPGIVPKSITYCIHFEFRHSS